MQTNKLTIGDRVITTRRDGGIGIVRDLMLSGTGYWTALISFDEGVNKWIGVDYLTRQVTPIEGSGVRSDDTNSDMMAVFSEI